MNGLLSPPCSHLLSLSGLEEELYGHLCITHVATAAVGGGVGDVEWGNFLRTHKCAYQVPWVWSVLMIVPVK